MMFGFFILLGLFLVSAVGPGFLFVRRLPWKPIEKLGASLGLSFILLYLSAFLVYGFDLPNSWYRLITALCALSTLICGRDLARLFARRSMRRQLSAIGALFLWGLLLLCLVHQYTGGAWIGDWWEQNGRVHFFLDHLPRDYAFLGKYSLPARPPLANLVATYFLAQAGDDFPLFQVVYLILNLFVLVPLFMLLPVLAAPARPNRWILVGLLMANPLLWQNATFTWTKLFSAFYVLLGLAFYVAGWRRGDRRRIAIAFLSLAAGFLAHYSAGPYLMFVMLHYLVAVVPRQPMPVRGLGAGLLGLALLATWFGWSTAVYGARETFGANTTATEWKTSSPSRTARTVLENVESSFIPHPLRDVREQFDRDFSQRNPWGRLRDYTFFMYQTNFIVALGSVGGLLVLVLAGKALWSADWTDGAVWFWLPFVVFCAVVGVAVHPSAEPFGVAHICGQPLVLLGVAFLAARYFSLPRVLQWAGIAGAVADLGLGVFLQFYVENVESARAGLEGEWSIFALRNWRAKERAGWDFWGDHFQSMSSAIKLVLVMVFGIVLARMISACRRTSVTVHSSTASPE